MDNYTSSMNEISGGGRCALIFRLVDDLAIKEIDDQFFAHQARFAKNCHGRSRTSTPSQHFKPSKFFYEMVWKALLTPRTGDITNRNSRISTHGQVAVDVDRARFVSGAVHGSECPRSIRILLIGYSF